MKRIADMSPEYIEAKGNEIINMVDKAKEKAASKNLNEKVASRTISESIVKQQYLMISYIRWVATQPVKQDDDLGNMYEMAQRIVHIIDKWIENIVPDSVDTEYLLGKKHFQNTDDVLD